MAASCIKDMTYFSVVLFSYPRLSRLNLFKKYICNINRYSTAVTVKKHQTTMDENVDTNSSTFVHRKHPGILKCRNVQLPVSLQESITVLLAKYPVHELKDQTQFLVNYLASRKRPVEDTELRKHAIKPENEFATNSNSDYIPDRPKDIKKRKTIVMNKLKRSIYHWQTITYNEMVSVAYLMGRFAANYAAIYRAFNEIKQREPDFFPEAILDFGSGLCTSVWAAEATWDNKVKEYMCIDISKHMHAVADALLRDGDENRERTVQNVFQRHFIPLSPQCQHDLSCPKTTSTKENIEPCNCVQEYKPIKESKVKSNSLRERFSYVILRKGARQNRADGHWPRLVEPVIQRSRHVICNLCCANGQLQRPVITKTKHGKDLYRCTRHSNQGDLLPISHPDTLTDPPSEGEGQEFTGQ
ncbi:ribosome assembly protein METTL17, mitochondrial-like isoform X2 [Antedon mediterranea]|uniref:ribosome assembly protein METTL17, mitochondrial-like isoform X2 n=1 Tax=Antedon mediterranea TaxID=105859 RepID=UPI003AF54628